MIKMDEITTKPNEWINVAYIEGTWIGERDDGSFISTRGEADNWIWRSATDFEIKQFKCVTEV